LKTLKITLFNFDLNKVIMNVEMQINGKNMNLFKRYELLILLKNPLFCDIYR